VLIVSISDQWDAIFFVGVSWLFSEDDIVVVVVVEVVVWGGETANSVVKYDMVGNN
jgi:hypothetical protein